MATESHNPGAHQQAAAGNTGPNPAGHLRGKDRPAGMTDAEWEAERDRVNRERFVAKHGREPGVDDDLDDDDGTDVPPTTGV